MRGQGEPRQGRTKGRRRASSRCYSSTSHARRSGPWTITRFPAKSRAKKATRMSTRIQRLEQGLAALVRDPATGEACQPAGVASAAAAMEKPKEKRISNTAGVQIMEKECQVVTMNPEASHEQ
ncbi:hypothetical protein DFP72DRAFT_1082605 [Ephemerocybe angulata]|uniref:Uncharacterized protein n=1 Tax=Ephemerocybe angulata TaxID=980116 RepID=A0A8H6LSH5_9AGAR|nr:hypothetical protein DFP72DRAFT_1082605 [Tulosesus angulatus]